MTNEELKNAIEKYQEKHPLHFGAMLDVTEVSSKEDADIISQAIERISKEVSKDTDLWCICEMAKLYMQGVKPVYHVRPQGEWIPVSERLPEIAKKCIVQLPDGHITIGSYHSIDKWTFQETSVRYSYPKECVIAWQPLPEAYKEADND